MTFQITLLGILFAAMFLWFAVDSGRGKKKQLQMLQRQFGAVPHSDYKRTGISRYWSVGRQGTS